MSTALQTGQSSSCSVDLIHEGRHIHLVGSLGEPFTGGSIVTALPDAVVAVEAADEAAKGYVLSTWVSGVASGALYAFRSLQVPRRRLWLSRLEGKLGGGDMGALALAASLLVAKLSGKEPPPFELGEWTLGAGAASSERTGGQAPPNGAAPRSE